MKPIIIAIVGPSGCGKTTMAEYIKETFGIPTIVSFTTRPMRENERNGREHYFTSEEAMPPKSLMLAYTKFDGCHYWAKHNQIPKQGICTYVIDEKGLMMLDENYGDQYELFPILIKMDADKLQADIQRIQRDKCRVKLDDNWFKLIIENNGTLEEFKQSIRENIKNIINQIRS